MGGGARALGWATRGLLDYGEEFDSHFKRFEKLLV